VNKPNTIGGTCVDGASGTYHSDESNDRIKVATNDGTNLGAGKQVTVTATVWAYSTTADTADIYYAANANSPVWTLIGSYKPSGTGARTITATYTLPTGTLQAVRVNFRYNGTAGTCTTGAYDDRDDLIFAVQ
jgi:leucyl aminopeptidase